MGSIKILGGDVPAQTAAFVFKTVNIRKREGTHHGAQPVRSVIKSVEVITDANKVKFTAAAGWGTVGLLLAGPIGLGVGALLGGRGSTVTFVAKMHVGKQFVAQTDSKTFAKLLAAVL